MKHNFFFFIVVFVSNVFISMIFNKLITTISRSTILIDLLKLRTLFLVENKECVKKKKKKSS